MLPYCFIDEAKGCFRLPARGVVVAASAVVCSCAFAGVLREGEFGRVPASFDFVLVDEAGQAIATEALIPMTLAAAKGGLMLCGDPRQLGPIVRSPDAAAHGLAVSLLEQFIQHHVRAAAIHGLGLPQITDAARRMAAGQWSPEVPAPLTAAALSVGMLVRNYRSHPRLLELPSRLFYDNSLMACAEPDAVQAPAWDQLKVGLELGAFQRQCYRQLGKHGSCCLGMLPAMLGLCYYNSNYTIPRVLCQAAGGSSGPSSLASLMYIPGINNLDLIFSRSRLQVSHQSFLPDDLYGSANGGVADQALPAESPDEPFDLLPTNTLFFGVRGSQVGSGVISFLHSITESKRKCTEYNGYRSKLLLGG